MALASSLQSAACAPNPAIRPVLGAYYPSWKIYSGDKPSQLRLDVLTHVYYAFARIDASGNVIHLDQRADDEVLVDGNKGCLAALVKLKRETHPHLRILLSIGGGSGSQHFASVAADRAKSQRFCETARSFLDRYGLDGVDLDWEHPKSAAEGQTFVTLLSTLRLSLPAPRYTLTAALPAGEWCLNYIDLRALLNVRTNDWPILDMLNVMCYDFAGPWTDGQSGHHAQLRAPSNPHNAFARRSLTSITEYLVEKRGVDPKRIVLGIPTYGRQFHGVKGPGKSFQKPETGGDGTIEYRKIRTDDLALEKIDHELGAASCCSRSGGWISYDNAETVRMKARFVKEKGLGGVFFWTGSYDAEEADRSLVLAAAGEFRSE